VLIILLNTVQLLVMLLGV